MKILLFSYYFIVSVQFTFVIPNSFIEFSFAALIIIGSHFCEPFLYEKAIKNAHLRTISSMHKCKCLLSYAIILM